jgi:pantoate--beta-alanine ligase
MKQANSIAELRAAVGEWRLAGCSVALVPTMGNLHVGHLQLLEAARHCADKAVVSSFVNPTQFGPNDDFDAYPRTPEADCEKLRQGGADLLFTPSGKEIYPPEPSLAAYVEVPGLSDDLCGRFRPGHFRGVATIVCKLLNLVQPRIALFGEKDYQQLTIIRRMVDELNLPVEIRGVATVREPSGLAMSSRNAYLSPEETLQAAGLYRHLLEARERLAAGERRLAELEADFVDKLASAGFKPDYFAVRRLADLAQPNPDERELIILAAAWLGKARLIDNLKVRLSR